jgi:hypothetical protein
MVVVLGGVAVLSVALHVGPVSRLVADPGVESCKGITAEHSATPAPGASASNSAQTLTADEYKKARKQFTDSRYADLRTAGAHFVDLVWQASGSSSNSDANLGSALALLGPLVSAYSDLSGACANHGVVLPPLMS